MSEEYKVYYKCCILLEGYFIACHDCDQVVLKCPECGEEMDMKYELEEEKQ